MTTIYLDAEYRNSQEPNLHLLCMSVIIKNGDERKSMQFWLESPEERGRLRDLLLTGSPQLICHNVLAEGRALIALGLNPLAYDWYDTMLEFRQLANGNYEYMYGNYIDDKGRERKSYPPTGEDSMDDSANNAKCPCTLESVFYRLSGGDRVDSEQKRNTLELILSNKELTSDDRQQILAYNMSDVNVLPLIHSTLKNRLIGVVGPKYHEAARLRGRWAACLSILENTGIPLDMEALTTLAKNHEQADTALVEEFNKVAEFYVKERNGKYVEKYSKVSEFIQSIGIESWPRTATGKLKTDDETLKEMFPKIQDPAKAGVLSEYSRSKQQRQQLKWLSNERGVPVLFQKTGRDSRVRPFFNPYGTQTGRNAPPAKQFIFAMSSWLRSCIRPQSGLAITGADYASQEFLAAALLAGDKRMEMAYNSGDPYVWLAKQAGAINEKTTPENFKLQRRIFKSLSLGLQYGLGSVRLAKKLSVDSGLEFSRTQAEELRQIHYDAYSDYWDFIRSKGRQQIYHDSSEEVFPASGPYDNGEGYLATYDGWYLFLQDEDKMLSIRNFPVQAGAQVPLRNSIYTLLKMGVQVIAPLHDAIYAEHLEGKAPEMASVMRQCFHSLYGGNVRVDMKTHSHSDVWLEEKGEKNYQLLRKYLGGRHLTSPC